MHTSTHTHATGSLSPHNRLLAGSCKERADERRQFLGHIVIHLIICSPLVLGCVEVESCTLAEIIGVAVALEGTSRDGW